MAKSVTPGDAATINPLVERFPDLYYDTKEVEVKTPKPTPPSISQVMAKVLSVNGVNNNSLASDLGSAAEAYYKGV
jgi:hypothetical protein